MKRSPIRPMSKKRRSELAARRRVREQVIARDGKCQFPHDQYPEIPCWGETFGHIVRESQGGAYTPENGVFLCATSNSWLSDHPAVARALGLEKSRWAS